MAGFGEVGIPALQSGEDVNGSFNRSYEAAPERINPKPDDLPRLMSGWMALVQDSQRIDPVVAAAVVSFSFVYLHPLEDGNGRLHRYLLHHILAERDFTPRGIVFPLSMPMLEKEEAYRNVLHSFDEEVMPFTDWRPNDAGGVEVLNETADLFRYMDLTEETDFVFDCVENAALQRLPEEISAIRKADDAMERLSRMVDLPEKRLRHLIMAALNFQVVPRSWGLGGKNMKKPASPIKCRIRFSSAASRQTNAF